MIDPNLNFILKNSQIFYNKNYFQAFELKKMTFSNF